MLDRLVESSQGLKQNHLVMSPGLVQVLVSIFEMESSVHDVQSRALPGEFGGLIENITSPLW